MYKASCLCASVELQIDGAISEIIHCHCSRCRKSSGTAFATNGFVHINALTVIQGQQNIKSYSAKAGSNKYFCSVCGSPLFSQNSADPKRVRLRLGIIDSDITERPNSHNFCTSKANWEQLNDRLPHYKRHEPNRSKPPKD